MDMQLFQQNIRELFQKTSRIFQFLIKSMMLIAICWPYFISSSTYNSGTFLINSFTSLTQQITYVAYTATSISTSYPSSIYTIHFATQLPPPIVISTPPDYVNYILQAIYDFLTLLLVTVSIWSIITSRQQSQRALEESRVQSQNTLTVAREQTEKSERQSQLALGAVHEQIDESKRQAQESIYVQIKPILVCTNLPEIRGYTAVDLMIENVGLGVATDIWGFLNYDRSKSREYEQYNFVQSAVLAADKERTFHFLRRENNYKLKEIERFSFFPQNNGDIIYTMRLTITYHDVFNRKHLSIFDFSETFGWRQIILKSEVMQTLEEIMRNEHEI